jgi:hypothetical protein
MPIDKKFLNRLAILAQLHAPSSCRVLLGCRVALHNRRLVAARRAAICKGVDRLGWCGWLLRGHMHSGCVLVCCEGKHGMLR